MRKLEEGQMEEGRGDNYKWNFVATMYMQVRPSLRLLCTLTSTCHVLMRKNTSACFHTASNKKLART